MRSTSKANLANLVRAVFRGVGQVFFQGNALTGACFVLGITFSSPLLAAGSVVGSMIGLVLRRQPASSSPGRCPSPPPLTTPSLRRSVFRLESGETCMRWCGHPVAVTADLVRTSLNLAASWTAPPGSPFGCSIQDASRRTTGSRPLWSVPKGGTNSPGTPGRNACFDACSANTADHDKLVH
ncbi:MAG: urea transporter [Isosphaeraceae bacterium]